MNVAFDALNNKLELGDKVIFMNPKYRYLEIGTILSMANSTCQIDWNSINLFRQYYSQLIKAPRINESDISDTDNSATDFLGQKLEVGDKVLFMNPKYRSLEVGTIHSMSKSMCMIDWQSVNLFRQYFGQVVKLPKDVD